MSPVVRDFLIGSGIGGSLGGGISYLKYREWKKHKKEGEYPNLAAPIMTGALLGGYIGLSNPFHGVHWRSSRGTKSYSKPIKDFRTLLKEMGIEGNTKAEIISNYRKWAQRTHPDKFPDPIKNRAQTRIFQEGQDKWNQIKKDFNFQKMAGFLDWAEKNINYAGDVVRHKWTVYNAARKLGVPFWQAAGHDINKFDPLLFTTYRDFFYDKKGVKGENDPLIRRKFYAAANLHRLTNPHHGFTTDLPKFTMNDKLEAVADWYAADKRSKSYPSDFPTLPEWWEEKKNKLRRDIGTSVTNKIDRILNK